MKKNRVILIWIRALCTQKFKHKEPNRCIKWPNEPAYSVKSGPRIRWKIKFWNGFSHVLSDKNTMSTLSRIFLHERTITGSNVRLTFQEIMISRFWSWVYEKIEPLSSDFELLTPRKSNTKSQIGALDIERIKSSITISLIDDHTTKNDNYWHKKWTLENMHIHNNNSTRLFQYSSSILLSISVFTKSVICLCFVYAKVVLKVTSSFSIKNRTSIFNLSSIHFTRAYTRHSLL